MYQYDPNTTRGTKVLVEVVKKGEKKATDDTGGTVQPGKLRLQPVSCKEAETSLFSSTVRSLNKL